MSTSSLGLKSFCLSTSTPGSSGLLGLLGLLGFLGLLRLSKLLSDSGIFASGLLELLELPGFLALAWRCRWYATAVVRSTEISGLSG